VYKGLSVGVVVPAYNEERLLGRTLARIPAFVDSIIVVDDSSADLTFVVASSARDDRIRIVRHTTNRGVGGAILSGYREVVLSSLDVAVVMAGDGQMDPDDLPALLDPIAEGRADYCKGNRFLDPAVLSVMPKLRMVGNLGLSLLTRYAAGYEDVLDSQCGYTAVTSKMLALIDLAAVYPRYGFPNDFLSHLHSAGARLTQVRVRPIYEGQKSGISPLLAVLPLSYVLARSFLMRQARERSSPARPRAVAGES
jgi:glycosyltransferase involved in cell wall biosynthesis